MMSHQDRGMKTAVVLLRGFVQDLAIQVGIIRMEEAGGAVVAALDDRLGEVRGIDSGEASPCILSNVGGYLWTRREHKSAKFTLTLFLLHQVARRWVIINDQDGGCSCH